jgi:hypothetical protein
VRTGSGLGRLQLEAVVAEVAAEALLAGLHPEVMEAAHPGGFADLAEGVDVAVADLAPVLERDAQLEGRLVARMNSARRCRAGR